MGDALNMGTAAAQGRADAAISRANGRVQRNQAYANAYKLEADATAASHIAGDNMMTLRRNQALQVASQRASTGASGFENAGSKLGVEQSTAEIFDMVIANAMQSNAIADQNAREQANATRRWGDTTQNLAIVQGDYLDKVASINSRLAPWALVGGGLSLGGNLLMQYNMAAGASRASGGAATAATAGGGMAGRPSMVVNQYGMTGMGRR